MRILTFTSLFPNSARPSASIFVAQRVAALASRPGNQLRVVAPVPYLPRWLPPSQRSWLNLVPAKETIAGVDVYHPRYLLIPKVSMALQGWSMFLASVRLVERLRSQADFDCIDAHYVYPDGFAAVLLGRHFQIPVIVSARGTDINLFPSFPVIRPMIRWTLRNAAGIVAVSEPLKANMVQLGISPGNIVVIGNGIDAERFHPGDRNAARQRLGIDPQATVIVAVGALREAKGFQFLLRAVSELAPRWPKLLLYIVGEGAFRPRLEHLIDTLGLRGRAHLVGAQPHDELKFWFSAADVSCLPSLREGQPNVVLESLACGTPVVATTVGGIPDIIDSPDLGVLVDDLRSLADALDHAVRRSWDRARLSSRIINRSWADVAAEVEGCITSACARSHARTRR